jgi:hypothetical protein
MKKMFVLVVGLMLSSVLLAQKPVWGLKGGLNFATLRSTENDERFKLDSRIGYHLGIISHNHLTRKIAIQPELQFSSQGTEVNTTSQDFNWRLSYINVPVMFQYMFNNGFRVEAGPYVGFLLGAKALYDDGTDDDLKDDFKTFDAGLGLGLNYLTYSGFGFGGRYNIGLANISDGDERVQNRVFQLSVFYMFDNDHKRRSR